MAVDERLYDSSYLFHGMKSADADPTTSAADGDWRELNLIEVRMREMQDMCCA
jgi:hypothetical protein